MPTRRIRGLGPTVKATWEQADWAERLRQQADQMFDLFFTEAARDMLGGNVGEVNVDKYAGWKDTYDAMWGIDPALDNLAMLTG